jgi:hypothetical protein
MVSTSHGLKKGTRFAREGRSEGEMNQELTRHVQDWGLGNVVRNYLGSVAAMYIGKRRQEKSSTDRHSRR